MSNSSQAVAKRRGCSLSTAKRKIRNGYLWAMKQARKRGDYGRSQEFRTSYNNLK